jgi:TP53 regulating kinase-like protein
MKLLYQGAEAKLYKKTDSVVKDRFSKKYRHPSLDSKIRKARTKREAKVLLKLQELKFPCSHYITHDEKNMQVEMEFIEGPMLKEVFEKDVKLHAQLIGKNIALLHKHGIIHGDLTTSNMILNNDQLHFIDFGLSFFSTKAEDMAVDLHVLKQALESKHYEVFEGAFAVVMKEYAKHHPDAQAVLKRLETVEKRGRHKQQY